MNLLTDEELPSKEIKAKQHPWANTIKVLHSHRIKHAHNSIRNPKYPVKEEKQPYPNRVQFKVVGDRVTKEFIFCKNLVIGLHKYKWKNFDVPIIKGCSSIEWPDLWHDLKVNFPGDIANCLQSTVAVFVNGKILGGEKELQQLVDSKYYYHLCLDYFNEGVAEFSRFIRSSGRPFAYMHVSIDDTHIGTLIFMLYADIVPNTCENFLRLCKEKKGGYGGTPVHRIVKDGWIQCGGFGLKSTPLGCENFIIPFDKRGVLAMTNDGRDDECSTQFFVLLQPAPWMNHKYVAFGQLIEGAATLEKIESVTTWYESPTSKIILYRCGILNMECHDIRINRGASEYIDGHIEDLNVVRKLIWERILETVFLKAQLREIERLREQYEEGAESRTTENDEKFEETDEDFALKKTEYEVSEKQDDFDSSSTTSGSQVVQAEKPYYIPLTDVPYPGDVESDFDLKRFLKGDYCLECDLDVNAYEKAKTKESITFYWSDDESTSPLSSDQISLDSEQQREIDDYLKNNVDRVSFAGGVIKSIAKMSTKATDIFSEEKRRASVLITDEQLRKMKMASADLMYRERRQTKVSIAAPGAYDAEVHKEIKRRQTGFVTDADLEKIRVFSRQHFGGFSDDDSGDDNDDDDDDDQWSNTPRVRLDPTVADPSRDSTKRIQRRPTGFIPSSSLPPDDDDDDDDDDEVVRFARQDLEKSAPSEALMKRRPTTFVRRWDLPVVDDDDDDDDDNEDSAEGNVNKPHFTAGLPEPTAPSEALKKRRPTSFVRRGDLPVDDDDDDDDDNEDSVEGNVNKPHFTAELPEPTAPSEALKKRRPTSFVRRGDFPVDDDDDDDNEDSVEGNVSKLHFTAELPKQAAPSEALKKRRPTSFIRPGELPVDDDDDDDTFDDVEEPTTEPFKKIAAKFAVEDDKPSPKPASHAADLSKRRATSYVRASDIHESGDVPVDRGSVLTRLYNEINNDEPGPTLKNYKPTAELHNSRLLLTTSTSLLRDTSGESRLGARDQNRQHSLILQESFDKFADVPQHGNKLENKVSNFVKTIDKFEKRFSHSIRSKEYAKKRPTITVSQYQLMNRQYQEALDRKTTPL